MDVPLKSACGLAFRIGIGGVPGSLVGRRTIAAIATVAGFVAGLAVTLGASELLVRGLSHLGTELKLSEGLLGLLAALGADSPELSSALVALLAGAGSVGVGVIVGSNLFNLAALLGLSAVLARGVTVRRAPLLIDTLIALLATAAAAAMVSGLISPVVTAVVLAPFVLGYAAVLAFPGRRVVESVGRDLGTARPSSRVLVMGIPIALAGVVGGAYVMVHEALAAQSWLHLSGAVLGTIVLAALTSLPNLYIALHFARRDRGVALYSSAMNSNTINLVGGLIVPALFVGIGAAKGSLPDFVWLIALTLLAVLAPLRRSRLTAKAGVAIVAVYVAFGVLRVLRG